MQMNCKDKMISLHLDMVEVVGSSPISPTKDSQLISEVSHPALKTRVCRLFAEYRPTDATEWTLLSFVGLAFAFAVYWYGGFYN